MINILIEIVIDRLGGRRIERLTDGVLAPTQAPFSSPVHKPYIQPPRTSPALVIMRVITMVTTLVTTLVITLVIMLVITLVIPMHMLKHKPLTVDWLAISAHIPIVIFIAPQIITHRFAHVLDSLVRVSRRVK